MLLKSESKKTDKPIAVIVPPKMVSNKSIDFLYSVIEKVSILFEVLDLSMFTSFHISNKVNNSFANLSKKMVLSNVNLNQLLNQYHTNAIDESQMLSQTISFVETYPNCFERTLTIGHITASAWITDVKQELALLCHHKKLNKWLQLGGHCDGNPNVQEVALKEAQEESGLQNFQFKTATIFDIDIHKIPAHKNVPEHLHYDIRFWLLANPTLSLIVSNESKDLKWILIDEIHHYNNERSIMRMVEKIKNSEDSSNKTALL